MRPMRQAASFPFEDEQRVHFFTTVTENAVHSSQNNEARLKKENVWIEKGEVKFLLLEDDKDALDRHPQVFC